MLDDCPDNRLNCPLEVEEQAQELFQGPLFLVTACGRLGTSLERKKDTAGKKITGLKIANHYGHDQW